MNNVTRWNRWWKPRILDGLRAIAELLFALLFSSLWLVLLTMQYGLDTPGIGVLEAGRATIAEHFNPADALQYLTAILASTTAYTLIRLGEFRSYIYRVVLLLLVPGFLWLLATPLLMVPEPANADFARRIAVILISVGVFVWWFSLFNHRRILEKSPSPPSDAGAKRIVASLGHD